MSDFKDDKEALEFEAERLADDFLCNARLSIQRHAPRMAKSFGEIGDTSQLLAALVTAQALIYSADVCSARIERVADSLDDVTDTLDAFEQAGAPLRAAAVAPAAGTLLEQWAQVLQFRIGEGGEGDDADLSQLPDPRTFPDAFLARSRYPGTDPASSLGHVLAMAYVKFERAWKGEGEQPDSGYMVGGWLPDIKRRLGAMRSSYGPGVGESFVMSVGTVLSMALNAPERLPVLTERIDQLDNATLHRMALDAVQGLEVLPDLFEGL